MMEPFSMEKLRAEYGDLEVMISPTGDIYFAEPSHQEFLIERVMERK